MNKISKNEQEISKVKQRILEFIEIQDITLANFCKNTGVSVGNFSGESLKSELGGKHIVEILKKYKEISPDWLLLGEGDFFRKNNNKNTELEVKFLNEFNSSYLYCHPQFIESYDNIIKEKDNQIARLISLIEHKLTDHD